MKETPKQYTQRMLGNVAGKNPLAVQAATAGKLARLTRGLSGAQLRRRPAPGKWSIGEILAHLADAEIVAGYRFRMMLNSSGGVIPAFDQNDWARNGRYDRIDPKRSLQAFTAMRVYNLALLKSLKPAMRKRYGMHAERGKESVAHYTRMMAGHDLNHLAQVERIARGFRCR